MRVSSILGDSHITLWFWHGVPRPSGGPSRGLCATDQEQGKLSSQQGDLLLTCQDGPRFRNHQQARCTIERQFQVRVSAAARPVAAGEIRDQRQAPAKHVPLADFASELSVPTLPTIAGQSQTQVLRHSPEATPLHAVGMERSSTLSTWSATLQPHSSSLTNGLMRHLVQLPTSVPAEHDYVVTFRGSLYKATLPIPENRWVIG